MTTSCLAITALVTPYEVAFLSMPPTWSEAWGDPLFVVNRLVDVTFVIDLLLQFVLMYQDQNRVEGVKWIDEPAAIAHNYLAGWFSLDFFSILPSTFDMLPYALAAGESVNRSASVDGGDILKRFKFLRVLRCFRLIKLVRLLRASRMVARWETRLHINYAYLSLWKMLIAYVVIAHWSACLLVLPTTFYENLTSTWLGGFGYCVGESLASPAPGATHDAPAASGSPFPSSHPHDDECYKWLNLARGLHADDALADQLLSDGTCRVVCEEPSSLFVAAFFLTLQVICGATGGVLNREMFNVQEQLLLALISSFGALLWGQIIGTFVSVIANVNSDVTWFRATSMRAQD